VKPGRVGLALGLSRTNNSAVLSSKGQTDQEMSGTAFCNNSFGMLGLHSDGAPHVYPMYIHYYIAPEGKGTNLECVLVCIVCFDLKIDVLVMKKIDAYAYERLSARKFSSGG